MTPHRTMSFAKFIRTLLYTCSRQTIAEATFLRTKLGFQNRLPHPRIEETPSATWGNYARCVPGRKGGA